MNNRVEMVSAEQLLYGNCIRYTTLQPIINEAFKNSKADIANVYVDLYSLLKVLYSTQNYTIGDYAIVASGIINICAHYRKFFRTRYRVETRFYIINSKNCPMLNKQLYPEYNSKNEYMFSVNQKVADLIDTNMNLLEIICEYLPDIFLIKSDFEASVVMLDLMCKIDPQNQEGHIILTKDPYCYQLVTMKPQTIILRPKNNNGSYFINNINLFDTYIKERSVSPNIEGISPELLPAIVALCGFKERNIKSLINITRAFSVLHKAIFIDYSIPNSFIADPTLLWNALDTSGFNFGMETFVFRFKAMSVIFQHQIYMASPECITILDKLINKHDPQAVRDINDKYFIKCPLNLNDL